MVLLLKCIIMTPMVTIEIYKNGVWECAATLQVANGEAGHAGAATLDYHSLYAANHLESVESAISVNYPVNFETHDSDRWPAFLLDILPSGAGRRRWADRLGIKDGLSQDVEMLRHACANPPGNLRIRESVENRTVGLVPDGDGQLTKESEHPGFERKDILERQEHFIEYAFQMGAHAAGASDVQGESPKFLLVQNHHGNWFAEGALPDKDIAKHWLVKFPRGRSEADKAVLRNEAPYLEVARACGLNVGEALSFEANTLFIPRFDRQSKTGRVERYSMESLYSVAGIAEYGAATPHEDLIEALLKHVAPMSKLDVICEYIKRDVLNVVLGNKDNHARNTAVMRGAHGVTLSPIFDFAPMYLDPEGVARVSRWQANCEIAGSPIWHKVAELFDESEKIKNQLVQFSDCIIRLTGIMKKCGVDDSVIEQREKAIAENARVLRGKE